MYTYAHISNGDEVITFPDLPMNPEVLGCQVPQSPAWSPPGHWAPKSDLPVLFGDPVMHRSKWRRSGGFPRLFDATCGISCKFSWGFVDG